MAGKRFLIATVTILFVILSMASYGQTTWYSYQDGDWSNPAVWTTDGSAFPLYVNPSSALPGPSDDVVITNGKKITIVSTDNNQRTADGGDDDQSIDLSSLEVIGQLDLTNSSGHNFTTIEGTGIIYLQGDGSDNENFPTYTTNNFFASDGGVLTIEGDGMTLDEAETYGSIEINLDNSSDIVTLMNDITINGDLTLTQGVFQFNDATNSVQQNMTVNGDVTVSANSSMTVGTGDPQGTSTGYGNYHKYFHVFTVTGSFVNNGTITFDNLTVPDYNTRATNGGVSLVFSGASDQTFNCNNTTDLYYLVISKGSDQTYSLTINSTDIANFALFGDNNLDWDDTDAANPEMRKALWIEAGTLILEGKIYIPSLAEGGVDYSIGENAGLVLNGPDVEVWTTASAANTYPAIWPDSDFTGLSHGTPTGFTESIYDTGIYLFGTLKINDGTFSTNESWGLVYRAEAAAARFEINGGTALMDEFIISSAASVATAKMSYIQTGGSLYLKRNEHPTQALFNMGAQLGTFTMSGGSIYIEDVTASDPSSIDIGCDPSNINVSGGAIIINNTLNNTITTTAPFYNLTLNAAGTITANNDLEIQNSLTLNAGTLNMANFDISIGKDLTLASGITLSNLNDVTFDGTANSRIFNSTGSTLTLPNDLIINKSDEEKSLTLQTQDIIINGQLNVQSGNFDYNDRNATVADLYVADTIGTTSSTGDLILGTGAVTITSDNGVLHNVDFDNTNGASLSGDITIDGTFTFTDGVFDLNTSKLRVGPNGSIVEDGTFGETVMFRTDGNQSDGGMELYINGDGNYLFPLGTDANADTRYTPITVDMAASAGTGYIQFSMGDENLAAISELGGNQMTYFWRLRHSDFSATTDIVTSITMVYDDADSHDGNTLQDNDNYYEGYVLSSSPFSIVRMEDELTYASNEMVYDGHINRVDGSTGGGTGAPEDFDLEEAYFTSGTAPAWNGAADVFYSVADGDWDDAGTWSDTGHNGTPGTGGSNYPQDGDIAIIGYDGTDFHRINAVGDITVGILNFNSLSGANAKDLNLSRLTFGPTEDITASIISGTGEMHFVTDGTNIGSIDAGADLGDFVSNATSSILYNRNATSAGTGDFTITALAEYPTIRFYAANANDSNNKDDRFVFDSDVTCENMVIDGNAALLVDQNITIRDSLMLGSNRDGELVFHNGATSVTVTVEDILFETDRGTDTENRNKIIVDAGNANAVEHFLIVSGNISMTPGTQTDLGAEFDLYTSATENNVTLRFTGTSDHTFTRTTTVNTPELSRLEVNMGSDTTASITIDHDFNLSGATNGSTKALQLDNGKLILNNSSIDIDLATGGDDYNIPSTAGLVVESGTINLNGTVDLTLNGLIRLDGASASLDMSGNENNMIYGTTGKAKLEIFDGSLLVGGQLRRQTTSSSGVLTYKQTGGSLAVGIDGASESNRGVFEIANNAGSSFTLTGGSMTVYRDNGASPTVAALFIDPASSSVSGSPSIVIGHTSVSPSNAITINSSVDLPDLTITEASNVTAQLMTQALTLTGDLNIGTATTGETFDANGLNLTIGGDLNNFGTYTANGNTLTFNGSSAQAITGTGSETIYNLTYSGTNTLSLSNDITVTNDLTISSSSGTLATGTNTLDVEGDVLLEGNITSSSGNGLRFSGSADQNLTRTTSGMSSIGIMTIDNGNEVEVPDGGGYEYEITETLILTDGVFNIGGNLLELDEDATISGTFSVTNMIKTNNAFLDNGVRKILPSTDNDPLSSYVIPVGETLYTPVTLDISDSGTGGANKYITVRPANEPHPSVANNATTLAYYWVVKSSNISDMTGDLIFQYVDPTHISGTEANYLPARLLTTSSTWDKAFTVTDVDDAANTITFSLTTEDSNEIEGEYTAGEDAGIGSNVETISTTGAGGNFSSTSTWSGGTIPSNGAIITVQTGATLTMDTDNRRFLRTEIQSGAVLDMGTSTGQSIGTVTGTGDIRISSSSFPNGDYTTFFTCSGGGIQYAGSTNYAILASIADIRNVTLQGTGQRQLPSNNINICEDLTLSGADLINSNDVDVTIGDDLILNSGTVDTGANTIWDIADEMDINGGTFTADVGTQIDVAGNSSFDGGTFNAGSATLNLSGNLSRTSGTFTAGTSSMVFTGTSSQSITGDFTTANSSSLYDVTINKSSNNVTVSSDVDITNNLDFTDGYFITTVADIFRLGLTATASNASDNSFVDGPIYKTLDNSSNDNFMFPIGASGFYARAGVSNTDISGDWYAEHVASTITSGSGGDDNDLPAGGTIHKNSYWNISGPDGATANVTLSLDGFDVSGNSGDWNDMRVMMYDNVTDNQWEMQGDADGSDDAEMTVTGTVASSFTVHEFTLGSVSADNPLPVELISFEARLTDKGVILDWSTASEINNDYFIIQRSTDGIRFTNLGTIDGNGTINQISKYYFVDHRPTYGVAYYRLAQYDYDGTETLFDPVVINNDLFRSQLSITLFPNPTIPNNVNVRIAGSKEQSPVQLYVYDVMGNLLHQVRFDSSFGDDTHSISVPGGLEKGVYQVVALQADHKVVQRLIIR